MTLRQRQTGKGCCLHSIRGQLPLHGPVLNKVPINSPFISDCNQYTSEGVMASRRPINAIDRLGRKKRRDVEVGVGETMRERIAEDEPQCRPQVLLSFSCVAKGDVSLKREDQIVTKRDVALACGRGRPDRKQNRLSPKRKCACRVGVGRVGAVRRRCSWPHNPPIHAHHLL